MVRMTLIAAMVMKVTNSSKITPTRMPIVQRKVLIVESPAAVADIVLTTLNARYAHASFGLRYLMANLPESLRGRAAMLEFDVSQRSVDVAEIILAQDPKIVG